MKPAASLGVIGGSYERHELVEAAGDELASSADSRLISCALSESIGSYFALSASTDSSTSVPLLTLGNPAECHPGLRPASVSKVASASQDAERADYKARNPLTQGKNEHGMNDKGMNDYGGATSSTDIWEGNNDNSWKQDWDTRASATWGHDNDRTQETWANKTCRGGNDHTQGTWARTIWGHGKYHTQGTWASTTWGDDKYATQKTWESTPWGHGNDGTQETWESTTWGGGNDHTQGTDASTTCGRGNDHTQGTPASTTWGRSNREVLKTVTGYDGSTWVFFVSPEVQRIGRREARPTWGHDICMEASWSRTMARRQSDAK